MSRAVSRLEDYVRDRSGLRSPTGGRSSRGTRADSTGTVSIVTIVFNAARTIERTIDSIAAQTYPNVEYILVDGGSTDGTLDLIRKREADIDLWLSEPDRGISDAFNKGIALARGEFIALVNADDWLEPQHMERAVNHLRRTEAHFVFGNMVVHAGDGSPQYLLLGDRCYTRRLRHAMPDINHPSVVCRRQVYERLGLYDTGLRVAMDYEWILRGYAAGVRGEYVPEITSHMEGSGISHRSVHIGLREVRDVSVRYGHPRWLAHLKFAGRLLRVTARTFLERWISREMAHRLRVLIHPGFRKMSARVSVRGTKSAV